MAEGYFKSKKFLGILSDRFYFNLASLVIFNLIFPFLLKKDKRISVIDALAHPYLDEGRLRYHSCMCKCCYTTSSGMRQYTADFEPAATQPFDDLWERKLTSVQQVKGKDSLNYLVVWSWCSN